MTRTEPNTEYLTQYTGLYYIMGMTLDVKRVNCKLVTAVVGTCAAAGVALKPVHECRFLSWLIVRSPMEQDQQGPTAPTIVTCAASWSMPASIQPFPTRRVPMLTR